ncbi:Xaa-Pro peptidase family protein [[Clostridium] symbiosum]|uniref:M24 family metallopeptidase n=1 Tax=Clostridium symbiosum TaxID=1512 RepID=UPI001D0856D5|nr:Xaa-Pro peptidase family protein [[Clostridium] symbiosum]MCB6609138.1 Xaa-Pro peptidase family protein [[Clostridium] symbiosum]MCB6933388.1 Xaa-Pro peptidase family protein [[Clostridium] symbiosum]
MDCKNYIDGRIDKLKNIMSEKGMDAVILTKPENVFYFSNFNPVLNSHPAVMIISLDDEPCLLVHAIRYVHACEEGKIDNVKIYGKWGDNIPLAAHPVDAAGMLLGKNKKNLGLELDYSSSGFCREIEVKLSPGRITDVSPVINMMKIIKDPYEISRIRRSAALVDKGVEVTIDYLKQGCSEAEACTQGQYSMRKMWHEKFSDSEVCGFGTSEGGMIDSLHIWCLSNGHIAYGCDCPRHYHPRTGDLTLPMAWAKTDGYHAENERTVIIGKLDSFKQNAYDAMLKARASIFRILKPGAAFEDLYVVAAKVYSESGFDSILPGRVGHGVGCSAHEFPSLEQGNLLRLEPGMVMTVEPGLMDKSWGGVRHSDTVLITEDGYEPLTRFEMGAIII